MDQVCTLESSPAPGVEVGLEKADVTVVDWPETVVATVVEPLAVSGLVVEPSELVVGTVVVVVDRTDVAALVVVVLVGVALVPVLRVEAGIVAVVLVEAGVATLVGMGVVVVVVGATYTVAAAAVET